MKLMMNRCSFWLNIFAYLSGVLGIIAFLGSVTEGLKAAVLSIVGGFVSFLVFRALALCTKAAEDYLDKVEDEGADEDPRGQNKF